MIKNIPPFEPEKYRLRKEAVRRLERMVKFLAILVPIAVVIVAALVPDLWVMQEGGLEQKDWLLIVTIAFVSFFAMIVLAGFLHIAYIQALHEYLIAREEDPVKRAELFAKYQKSA